MNKTQEFRTPQIKKTKASTHYYKKSYEEILKLCQKFNLVWVGKDESVITERYDVYVDKKNCFSKIHKETVYRVLKQLPSTDYAKGSFLFLANDGTHLPLWFGTKNRSCSYINTSDVESKYVFTGYLSKIQMTQKEIKGYIFGLTKEN